MKRGCGLLATLFPMMLLFASCTGASRIERDLVNDPFPQAQAELRAVVDSIVRDATEANIEGLQAIHLVSDKFTKFGPRGFDRQDVAGTNESEAAFFGSISNYQQVNKDLKIDVFGDVAVVTYYPHVSFIQGGVEKKGSGRQTLVLLKTQGGWKIVHEHGTRKSE